jgi:preprotein translocase subunit SecE
MVDKIKIFLALLVIAAGISGFYLLADMPAVVKTGAFVGSLAVAALIGWTSTQGKRFAAFVREAIIETRKVVWPTRKETVQSTAMVVAFVFVMAIFLWGVDWILATVVRLLMGVEA